MKILINENWEEFDINLITGIRIQRYKGFKINNKSSIKIICKCGFEQIISLKKFKQRKLNEEKCFHCLTKETMIKKYGVDHNFKLVDKIHQSNLKKYGFESPMKSDIIKEMIKNKNIERWGVSSPMKVPEFKENHRKVMQEKYHCDSSFHNGVLREKSYNTMLKKYGAKHLSQVENMQHLLFKVITKEYKTIFGNIIFYQSKNELKFIQYCESKNLYIKNGPKIKYILNEKEHFYFVDFETDQFVVEIKASHPWYFEALKSGEIDAKNEVATKWAKEHNKRFLFLLDIKNYNEIL